MRKEIVICDKCKKEITGTVIKLECFIADEDGEPIPGQEIGSKDLCEDCCMNLIRIFFGEAPETPSTTPEKPSPKKPTTKTKSVKGKKKYDVEELLKMREQGMTNKQIAEHFNSTPAAIATAISCAKKRNKDKWESVKKIINLLNDGKSIPEVAEMYGVASGTIHNKLIDYKRVVMTGAVEDPIAQKYFENKMRDERIDYGKMHALKKAGWSNKDIAGEFGVTEEIIEQELQNDEKKGKVEP